MKIQIDIEDIELFEKAFNNAIAAYGDIYRSISFGIGPQINFNKFSKLEYLPEGELRKQVDILIDVYEQIKGGI